MKSRLLLALSTLTSAVAVAAVAAEPCLKFSYDLKIYPEENCQGVPMNQSMQQQDRGWPCWVPEDIGRSVRVTTCGWTGIIYSGRDCGWSSYVIPDSECHNLPFGSVYMKGPNL